MSEYENKSFKSQLDLLKIHFKAFINMFTSALDHMINRCVTNQCDDEARYGINELKSILLSKINYFNSTYNLDLNNEVNIVTKWNEDVTEFVNSVKNNINKLNSLNT